jgi:hypothetical protein
MTFTISGVVMQNRSLLIVAIALSACRGPSGVNGTPPARTAISATASVNAHEHVAPANDEPLPVRELASARSATERYRDLQRALKDGYVDIGVVLPNMGRHYVKESLMDTTFEAERPEILVYTEDLGGRMKLVAVEYAVPLALSDAAPDGFPGGADVWFADQRFKLWTLHAWFWKENPDGVFNPTNRRVP